MDTIDQVKQKTDILDLLGGYGVNLKKAGRNYSALCPFHSEKTPSFIVFPDKQSWHCFGACATGGDIFSFVMKKENMDFGQALRLLAERAGVQMVSHEQSSARSQAEDRLKDINEAAAQFYANLLLNSARAESARAYLARRGINTGSIAEFGLGYSPGEWESAKSYLLGKGYVEKELVDAGILVKKDDGGTYDRFRNRLMFPIRDARGRTIGFGGRALDDSMPKYLNSPQSPVFDKGATLYGLDRAAQSIRRANRVVLVEGYFDVIMAHQHGFNNVIATMGTALSERQIETLKSLAKRFVLALDADAAGEMATLRSLETSWRAKDASNAGKEIKLRQFHSRWPDAQIMIMAMPAGKDPDEIILAGPDQWRVLEENAPSWMDFVFEAVTSEADVDKVDDRTRVVDTLLPFIGALVEPVEQAFYLQKLSRLSRTDERTLSVALQRLRKEGSKGEAARRPAVPGRTAAVSPGDPLEEYCLALLINNVELKSCIAGLDGVFFNGSENREICKALRSSSGKLEARESLDAPLRERFDSISRKNIPPLNEEERRVALQECIRNLRTRWLRGLKVREEIQWGQVSADQSTGELKTMQDAALDVNRQLQKIFNEETPEGA